MSSVLYSCALFALISFGVWRMSVALERRVQRRQARERGRLPLDTDKRPRL